MITAGELCNRAVVIVDRADTVEDAARLMRHHHVGAVIVVDQRDDGARVPAGIITDRDLVVGVLARDGGDLPRLLVGDLLTSTEVVTATESVSALDVLHRLRVVGIRRLPIVDATGALVGIITFDDLVGLFAEIAAELERVVASEIERERERRP